jgi:uncharacterized protein
MTMIGDQPIVAPFGVSVHGSAFTRVVPDSAAITFSVSQLKPHPKAAFQAVREAAQKVQAYLSSEKIEDAGSSRISLTQETRFEENKEMFSGYRTQVEFRVLLSDLSRLEEILAGVVNAGIDKISSVNFQTTELKKLQAQAQSQAVAAAHEKAEIYCNAAGVKLGEVIHIEDLSLDRSDNYQFQYASPDADSVAQAFDPSSLAISSRVMVAFKIQGQ